MPPAATTPSNTHFHLPPDLEVRNSGAFVFGSRRGFDELVDQGSRAESAIGRRHIDLKLAGHVIGSEPGCLRHSLLVSDNGQRLCAVEEFAARSRYRQCEYDRRAGDRAMVVILDLDCGVAGQTLTRPAGRAFSFQYDDADARRNVLRVGKWCNEKRDKGKQSKRKTALQSVMFHCKTILGGRTGRIQQFERRALYLNEIA